MNSQAKHILIAPNAFKNSLTAAEAAAAVEKGLVKSELPCVTTLFPIGDGGDGTCELIRNKLDGELKVVIVKDPLGRDVNAPFSLIEGGKTAIIEMADASGIRLLKSEELNPLKTTSYGTGQLIRAALDHGVSKIILGMGGSATVDGGCGMLDALGVRFLDDSGRQLKPDPSELLNLAEIDLSGMDARLSACEVIVLCDVKNKLLGQQGAAAVFGPQKGASESDVVVLDSFLSKLSRIVANATGRDMSAVVSGGAAGGAAAGMYAIAGARLVNGIDYFLELTGFEDAVKKADIVITGEGSIDEQTLEGKGPFGVAVSAKKIGKFVIGIAGSIPLNPSPELNSCFDVLVPANHRLLSLDEALKQTAANLERTGYMLGKMLMLEKGTA